MPRLTRAEQRDLTRQRVLDAAEQVFIDAGFHAASVDDIADRAGYTRGAVYSNFDNKDELFLAMLERRVDSRALAIESTIGNDADLQTQALQAGDAFVEVFLGQPRWALLLMEFATYAARDDDLRARFARRNRGLRAEAATFIGTHLDALGMVPPLPVEDLSTILFSMGSGFLLEKLLDPDAVPNELFGAALALLFAAAGPAAPSPPAPGSAEPISGRTDRSDPA